MHSGCGLISQVNLDGRVHVDCSKNMVPRPGQYLLAHAINSLDPLALPLFLFESTAQGFRSTLPEHSGWTVGTRLNLRGPLGHGFEIPGSARKIALLPIGGQSVRLRGLIPQGQELKCELVLLADSAPEDLPEVVEVQPLTALRDVCMWADFLALDASRENLPNVREILREMKQIPSINNAQILVSASMPCGGIAECGVCAVSLERGWKLTCKDGPVFRIIDLINVV